MSVVKSRFNKCNSCSEKVPSNRQDNDNTDDYNRTNNDNSINLISNFSKEFTIVAESGIKTHDQINKYNEIGIFNFLIGESILKSNNINNKIKELKGL